MHTNIRTCVHMCTYLGGVIRLKGHKTLMNLRLFYDPIFLCMRVYVCMCMYTCMHEQPVLWSESPVCACVCMHTRITHAYAYICIHTRITHAYAYIHLYLWYDRNGPIFPSRIICMDHLHDTYTNVHSCTHAYMHVHAYMCTSDRNWPMFPSHIICLDHEHGTYTYIYKHTHTHTHIYTLTTIGIGLSIYIGRIICMDHVYGTYTYKYVNVHMHTCALTIGIGLSSPVALYAWIMSLARRMSTFLCRASSACECMVMYIYMCVCVCVYV